MILRTFISIIVFVSFFFVEKFYKSIGHDLINNGYEVIEDSFESITKKYKHATFYHIKKDLSTNNIPENLDYIVIGTLENSNKLDQHLLPGVSTLGVPKSLGGLTHPFEFNN